MANKISKTSKRKYTAAQKRAYYMGMGYRAGCEGKKVPFRIDANKQSFREGYRAIGPKVAKYDYCEKK